MGYKISISPRAQQEIEEALDYYSQNSLDATQKFIYELIRTYKILKTNPFFRIYYKTVRGVKLHKFPYSLFFTVDKSQNTIKILSCFHNFRNPKKLPKSYK